MLLAGPVSSIAAADPPRFSLAIGGAFLRERPELIAPALGPAFAGESYPVVGRTADNAWLQLRPGSGPAGWVAAPLGRVDGALSGVPVAQIPAARPSRASTARSGDLFSITPRMRALYREAIKAGRDGAIFAVVGDCNSEPDAYWWRLTAGTFDVSRYPELHAAVARFAPAFMRGSAAAKGGFNTASMFDPAWSDPAWCGPDEGPLDCELRRSNASVVFISLGTGDTFAWREFEANYAHIIERALERKVVPVLVTKADDLESQQADAPPGAINAAVRRLGQRYGVPVIDFWQATRSLPDFGMRWEGNENFHMSPAGSDARIVLTLRALAALTAN